MAYRLKWASILGLLITVFTGYTGPFAAATSKTDLLKTIDDLLTTNSLSLRVIERKAVAPRDPRASVLLSAALLNELKEEHILRQEFLNRLKFQAINYYVPPDEKAFLDFALNKIMHQESLAEKKSGPLYNFALTVKNVLDKNQEKIQNPLQIVEYYFSQSKIRSPLTADEFIERQDYVGKTLMQTARDKSRPADASEDILLK